MGTQRFDLIDDGTLDTVVKCATCGEELRYNYAASEEESYEEFTAWCLEDAEDVHECELECLYIGS